MENTQLHWLDKLCKESGVTRYKISQITGIEQSHLCRIIKQDTPMDDCNYGIVKKILDAVEFASNVSKN